MVKVTGNIVQYPLHHVIYASAKFEVAISNSLSEDTIIRYLTDGRKTDFGSKLVYTFFFYEKRV